MKKHKSKLKKPAKKKPVIGRKSYKAFINPECTTAKSELYTVIVTEYKICLEESMNTILNSHKFKIIPSDYGTNKAFFKPYSSLQVGHVRNAREHASSIINAWCITQYTTKIKPYISKQVKTGKITKDIATALYTVGACCVEAPCNIILNKDTGESIDITLDHLKLYRSILLDTKITGKRPRVPNTMWFSGATGVIESSETIERQSGAVETTDLTSYWFSFSPYNDNPLNIKVKGYTRKDDTVVEDSITRKGKKWVSLPLTNPLNPIILKHGLEAFSPELVVQYDKNGRLYVQLTLKEKFKQPIADLSLPLVGLDAGEVVPFATHTGRLYGTHIKPEFDRRIDGIESIRASRQKQAESPKLSEEAKTVLRKNSKRLDRLEAKATGYCKTEVGKVVKQIKSDYSGYCIVTEKVTLTCLKGSKRFLFNHGINLLKTTVGIEQVPCPYSSQQCPSCGHISKTNRNARHFKCKHCGRVSHADVVGGVNVLSRAGDEYLTSCDDLNSMKIYLREQYGLARPPVITGCLGIGFDLLGTARCRAELYRAGYSAVRNSRVSCSSRDTLSGKIPGTATLGCKIPCITVW